MLTDMPMLQRRAVSSPMQAAQAFTAALNAKSAISAAFSTPLAVADEALTLVEAPDARLFSVEEELTKGQLERLKNLATLCDPVGLFRDIIADRLGHASWGLMSSV